MDFFSSDWHLGHHRVIEHDTNRSSFKSIEEHDEFILSQFEKRVRKDDNFFFLGDFCLSKQKDATAHWLWRMRKTGANLIFLQGNHDHTHDRKVFEVNTCFLGYMHELKRNDLHLTLCHYPMRSWNRSHHGSIHLHGHEHGDAESWGKSLDVCINNKWDLWSLDEIVEHLKDVPIKYMGHHSGNR